MTTRPRVGHVGIMRALIGLLLMLALGLAAWQSAVGAQCPLHNRETVFQLDGAMAVVEAAHGHTSPSDAPVAVTAHACSTMAYVAPVNGDPSRDFPDRVAPRTRLARFVTATDPPGIFRPPRPI